MEIFFLTRKLEIFIYFEVKKFFGPKNFQNVKFLKKKIDD